MEGLSKAEKRKLINARYYAKKRSEKGHKVDMSYDNLKLENIELKKTIEKLKEDIKNLKGNQMGMEINWSDDED